MEGGQCIIGMKSIAMIPLISFDAVVNVYLTVMFLIPLKSKLKPNTDGVVLIRQICTLSRTCLGHKPTCAFAQ